MPDPIENLQTLIAEQIEASRERCDAASETMQTLDQLVNEGRKTIVRSRAQLARANERSSFRFHASFGLIARSRERFDQGDGGYRSAEHTEHRSASASAKRSTLMRS